MTEGHRPLARAASLPIRQSSGDLVADKRFTYAEALEHEGDAVAAADLFGQVIELVPDWAPAHVALGLSLSRIGRVDTAIGALEKALELDPQDRFGAALHLARLRSDPAPEMSPAYVTALFDQYAPRFDAHLIEGLGYRGPAIIMGALDRVAGAARFQTALDLGCGTGLMARAATGRIGALDGIDLSAQMITQARATGLYRSLHVAECAAFLAGIPNGTYDLVLAADVFVYLGDLSPVLRHGARVLTTGGRIFFTVQSEDGEAYSLGDDLRFRHAPAYIGRVLAEAGLAPELIEACSSRREGGIDVAGLVVVARAS